jgi:hypothetical protein
MISLKNVSVSVSVSFVQSKFLRVSRICTGLPGRAKPDLVINWPNQLFVLRCCCCCCCCCCCPPTLFCSFRSFIPSLLHSFVRSSVCSFFTLFIRLIVRPLIRLFVHSLVSSFFEATLVLLLQRNLIGSLTFEWCWCCLFQKQRASLKMQLLELDLKLLNVRAFNRPHFWLLMSLFFNKLKHKFCFLKLTSRD